MRCPNRSTEIGPGVVADGLSHRRSSRARARAAARCRSWLAGSESDNRDGERRRQSDDHLSRLRSGQALLLAPKRRKVEVPSEVPDNRDDRQRPPLRQSDDHIQQGHIQRCHTPSLRPDQVQVQRFGAVAMSINLSPSNACWFFEAIDMVLCAIEEITISCSTHRSTPSPQNPCAC